ncbi:MAG: PH domain-containing protein [Blastocatellia bacterium]
MAANFKIAPMNNVIRILTVIMLMLPVLFLAAGIFISKFLFIPAAALLAIYLWIWLRFRPTSFVVQADFIDVIWPMKVRRISRKAIAEARIIDRFELTTEVGWAIRAGAGGIWGGFGWLWTQKRGIVQMHISRTDAFVWIECSGERPWLITPERPEEFVQILSSRPI